MVIVPAGLVEKATEDLLQNKIFSFCPLKTQSEIAAAPSVLPKPVNRPTDACSSASNHKSSDTCSTSGY